jgi:hypothetical protein
MWDYGSSIDEVSPKQLPVEWVWERLRARRDQLLASSDFRMIPDAPWDRAPWEAYRQALRDLPAETSDPREAVWPEPPTD